MISTMDATDSRRFEVSLEADDEDATLRIRTDDDLLRHYFTMRQLLHLHMVIGKFLTEREGKSA